MTPSLVILSERQEATCHGEAEGEAGSLLQRVEGSGRAQPPGTDVWIQGPRDPSVRPIQLQASPYGLRPDEPLDGALSG